MFLSPLEKRLGEGVNAKIASCISSPSPNLSPKGKAIADDKNSVIPTGAEPLDFARGRLREAQRRDLFCCLCDMRRSLDYAAPWAASLGMTG